MLACTHSQSPMAKQPSSVDERQGEYASDVDAIEVSGIRFFNHRNKGGRAYKVGTFNKHLTDAGHGDMI